MEMGRVFFTLIFLNCCITANAQQFSVVEEPICWSIGSIDSSLTRATYVSVTGLTLTVFYINAQGNSVDVSAGGNLSFGICGCCANVPPSYAEESPYIDTIGTAVCVFPLPPPPLRSDSTCCEYIQYAEIENITNSNQITITFESTGEPDLVTNAVGYYNNINGSINYVYTQLTPTKAAITIELYTYYIPDPASLPQRFTVIADNGAGQLTLIDCYPYGP